MRHLHSRKGRLNGLRTFVSGPAHRCALPLAMLAAATSVLGPGAAAGPAWAEDRAGPYTVERTIAHTERARLSPYVSPTASADDALILGQSRGWRGADAYPFDIDAADAGLTVYADAGAIPSHPLFGYRITDPNADDPPVTVALMTGNHNTEHTGSWSFEAMIDFLLSDDERAVALRREAVFYVYPLVNPDGRHTLAGRASPEVIVAGWLDHNRVWGTAGMISTIDTLTAAIRYDTRGDVDYLLDFHSAGSTFLFSASTMFDHPLVAAIGAREPEIGPRGFDTPGTTSHWARSDEGLAAHAFTPEHDNALTQHRAQEIGRTYALVMHDVLLGEFADASPARDDDADSDDSDAHAAGDDPDELLIAAATGEADVLATMLDADHDVQVTDAAGNTALHLAAEHGHAPAVALLLEHGADFSVQNHAGRTPLYLAEQHARAAALDALLDAAAAQLDREPERITERIGTWRFTRLHQVAGRGDTAKAALLLDHGAAVDARDEVARTPLRFAAEGGHRDTAALLLARGAAVDVRDAAGNTPLHLAATGCRPYSEHWATRCREDPAGDGFSYGGGHPRLAELLLDHGADPGTANSRGWTPLHYAARYDSPEVARMLIEYGADVDAVDVAGNTPLHVAANYGRLEIAQLLLEHRATPDLRGQWHRTPLDWAQRLGHTRLAELLANVAAR